VVIILIENEFNSDRKELNGFRLVKNKNFDLFFGGKA